MLDPPTSRTPFHPYPDELPDGISVLTYSPDELLAEKIRALYERTRPRDVYDIVYLLENRADGFDFRRIHDLFRRKCAMKGLEVPSLATLLQVVHDAEELGTEWTNMLAHQLPQLPDLEDLLSRLPGLLTWIDQPTAIPVEASLPAAAIPVDMSIFAPPGIQYWGGRPLETIRFAGANRLLVEFTYDGTRRLVEPYSLRRATTGNLLLYGWEQGSTHIKAFHVERISEVRATKTAFQPRYRIEFTPTGPLNAPPSAGVSRSALPGSRRTQRTRSSYGPTYVFECPICQKRFRRSTNDSHLRKHKAKDGPWDCSGRRGYLVSIE